MTTVAGSSNGSCATLDGGLTTLHTQAGIFAFANGTLYVANGDPENALLVFQSNNGTGQQIASYDNWPTYLFVDSLTSAIYVTVFFDDRVHIWPSNRTIPPTNVATGCSITQLARPTGIIVDSAGNVYISSYQCNWVTKWAPNASTATLVVGSPSATPGNDTESLNTPYGLFLDETHSLLYVVDRGNHRVQRFTLGNATGITVAGGNGAGTAANQLNGPTTIIVSSRDGSYYICDVKNNRVQKWAMNAAYGVTIAGSSAGIPGSSLYLLNEPYDIWVHPNETYMLVSDENNCRVQKYLFH